MSKMSFDNIRKYSRENTKPTAGLGLSASSHAPPQSAQFQAYPRTSYNRNDVPHPNDNNNSNQGHNEFGNNMYHQHQHQHQLENEESIATAPNFGNDYSDHFLRTGVLPQAHIQNATNPLIGYPRLQRLHDLKQAHTRKHACQPYCASVPVPSMPDQLINWANAGLMFDVVMVGGCLKNTPSLELLTCLPVAQLTPRPSIALIWVPSHGLDIARQALGAWGFRRSEDIVFLAMSKDSIFYPPQSDADFIEKSTWHCLMGLKGTLRRSEDADLINCNIDTDTILESPTTDRPNIIPEKIYKVVENFSLMSRRLHIIPGSASSSVSSLSSTSAANPNVSSTILPVRPRPGWVIVSPDCLLDNFSVPDYLVETKLVGSRVPIDAEIDALRPKTPPRAKRNEK